VRCLIEVKHSEDTGHLVEIILSLAETLLEFDAEENQRDLHPLGVPVRAVRRGGYVRVVSMPFDKISTLAC
jgi:hypothetical protein